MNFGSSGFPALALSLCLSIASVSTSPIDPAAFFRTPPQEAKPGEWWHWLGNKVSREGITHDLAGFMPADISSATILGMAEVCRPWAGHIEDPPNGVLSAFTDPWWKLVRHAAEEGRRHSVNAGLHTCPGHTTPSGPWITPKLAMQLVHHSHTDVAGRRPFSDNPRKPMIDLRREMLLPMINKDIRQLEEPVIEGRDTCWRDITVSVVPAKGTIAIGQIVRDSGVAESCDSDNYGDSGDTVPASDGTTRGGQETNETLDDSAIFRTYGTGTSLLSKLGNTDDMIRESQLFAGHRDIRASQAYEMWIAKADTPDHLMKTVGANIIRQDGASRLRVPVDPCGVVAVRLDLADPAPGFDVYREVCTVRPDDNPNSK